MWSWLPELWSKITARLVGKAADKIVEEMGKKVGGTLGDRIAEKLRPLAPSDLALPPDVHVVPKGLRSFDEEDATFFIHLLPGPYREDCLPECIHFWKSRIETNDPDKVFRVGVICGPSGCGKSSLLKAGLMPHLAADRVIPVYVEATHTDTKDRLVASLQKKCPSLVPKTSLRAALRRKDEIPVGKKVLIVLDQFEQYLHSTPEEDQQDLTEALRECDGEKLQCVLMVRDDFITPVTRFMKRLEIPLAEDRNLALVDLFDKRHSKHVLALLGQGYGALPKSGAITTDQDSFLNQAVTELADGDYVVSIRLALFAQMIKAKEWTPAALNAVGGTEGIGVTFLEEAFVTKAAPLENRRHERAAAEVLKALLPEACSDTKRGMRSKHDLREKSGYGKRPDDFNDLMEILDRKLRLVTPTAPLGTPTADSEAEQNSDGEKYYKLTHEFMVQPLRVWLTAEARRTFAGRVQVDLRDHCRLWAASGRKPKLLLSPWTQLRVLLGTTRNEVTETEKIYIQTSSSRGHALWRIARVLFALTVFCISVILVSSYGRLILFLCFEPKALDWDENLVSIVALMLSLPIFLWGLRQACIWVLRKAWNRLWPIQVKVLTVATLVCAFVLSLFGVQTVPWLAVSGYEMAATDAAVRHDVTAEIGYWSAQIRLDPSDIEARSRRGDLYAAVREYEAAIADYSAIIDGDMTTPNSKVVHLKKRAIVRFRMGSPSGALTDYHAVLDIVSDDDDAHVKVGNILWASGHANEAVESLRTASTLRLANMDRAGRGYPGVLLACLLRRQNDKKGAVEVGRNLLREIGQPPLDSVLAILADEKVDPSAMLAREDNATYRFLIHFAIAQEELAAGNRNSARDHLASCKSIEFADETVIAIVESELTDLEKTTAHAESRK